MKHLKNKAKESLPDDEAALRRKAVWCRQAIYIAMSINLGHRTGVYQNMTVDEFQRAVETEERTVITHVGGKRRETYKTVQVPVSIKLNHVMKWYVANLQPHLSRNRQSRVLLFPHLNPWDTASLDFGIEEIQDIPYARLLRGNRTRRQNVQLTHELDDHKELQGTNVRELAMIRCHTEAVASKTYDTRN